MADNSRTVLATDTAAVVAHEARTVTVSNLAMIFETTRDDYSRMFHGGGGLAGEVAAAAVAYSAGERPSCRSS